MRDGASLLRYCATMLLRSFVFLAMLTASAIALAGPARAPTARWNVDFADAQCLASRNYGTAQDPLQLILKSPAIGEVVQLAIARKGGGSSGPAQMGASVSVDGGPPFRLSMLAFSPSGSHLRIYSMNMPAAQFALVRRAGSLSIRSDGLDESFALSEMGPLLKVVDDCVADLRRVYNITDSATGETSSLKVRAKANLASLFSSDDYPGIAVERDQGGQVKFALLVAEDGRVADCTIIGTSGVASLDTQACALLRLRARFRPAAGTDGRPAKDAVIGRITWKAD